MGDSNIIRENVRPYNSHDNTKEHGERARLQKNRAEIRIVLGTKHEVDKIQKMSEAGRHRPGRVGQAPSRLADEQAAAAADAPNRRRAASAPLERQPLPTRDSQTR